MTAISHVTLRESIRTRIIEGEWKPGALIPAEEQIALEYNCSRTTVNRALQALADSGIIERKRRAGTRVAVRLVRRAQFEIPIIRHEIEAAGAAYRHRLLLKECVPPPEYVKNRLHLTGRDKPLHLQTVHLADGRPHAYEDRWVNVNAAPDILNAPLGEISANEWLVRETPYTDGEIIFSAVAADKKVANIVETPTGAPLMSFERTTWLGDTFVTTMKLYYKQGYELRTSL